ncbi:RNase H domain-containing protein [Nephila pilipes]|uniref:RNase H domain-containing protein n=1 Tax=Nephila pilipes TaxID=299642 RepID=A0A8X6QK45_NEPPI|nr:RNase H domain-containing protein [Nephila pilipes]
MGDFVAYGLKTEAVMHTLPQTNISIAFEKNLCDPRNSRVSIQWILFRVGVFGNEMVDLLAKEGSAFPSAASNEHFVCKIFSIHRRKANSTWRVPPACNWYDGNLLVCLYSPKVQDPHRLHWPNCELAILRA